MRQLEEPDQEQAGPRLEALRAEHDKAAWLRALGQMGDSAREPAQAGRSLWSAAARFLERSADLVRTLLLVPVRMAAAIWSPRHA